MWFISSSEGTPRKNRKLTLEDNAKRENLKNEVRNLINVLERYKKDEKPHPIPDNGVVFSPSDIIEDWQLTSNISHMGKGNEIYRISTSRLFGQAYKMAMIFTMMDRKFQDEQIKLTGIFPQYFDIPDEHAQAALDIVDGYLRSRILLVADLCEANTKQSNMEKIIAVLKENHGIASKNDITRKTHFETKRMNDALEAMESARMITRKLEPAKGDGGGRQSEIIILLL
jgi:hypothetical protein